MNTKPIIDPYPPIHIPDGDYPIHVFRVEKSPRLHVNSAEPQRNTVLRALHTHVSYEVFFVVSGTLELLTESGSRVYSDAIVIIPPHIHHVTVRNGESYCLLFSFDHNSTIAHYLRQNACELPLKEETVFYIRRLTEKTALRTEEGEQAVKHLAALIFLDIFRSIKPRNTLQEKGQHRDAAHISKIDAYINANYFRKITLAELAEHIHLSQRQTARIILQVYQCSFTELLSSRRLTNAANLLTHTDLSITQVIQKTFDGSPNYFYRIFQKKFGISPLQYRKQSRLLYPKE